MPLSKTMVGKRMYKKAGMIMHTIGIYTRNRAENARTFHKTSSFSTFLVLGWTNNQVHPRLAYISFQKNLTLTLNSYSAGQERYHRWATWKRNLPNGFSWARTPLQPTSFASQVKVELLAWLSHRIWARKRSWAPDIQRFRRQISLYTQSGWNF